MGRIKLFEEYNKHEDERITFIKSKINWNIHNYISDLLTNYSDLGLFAGVGIYAHKMNIHKNMYLLKGVENEWVDSDLELNDAVRILNEPGGGIFFAIKVRGNTKEKKCNEITEEIANKCNKKFNTEVVFSKHNDSEIYPWSLIYIKEKSDN